MSALVECVPNFSEGKNKAKVEAVVSAARGVAGVSILDVETDADHNRCVLSFVASPEAAVEACFRVAQKTRELIDLNHHKGEHPRMGAVDVIPFIPVAGVSIEECAHLAEKLGERIGRELDIPVYLYDRAAKIPERKDLANVRKGQFEGLRDLIGKDPSKKPDFGPNHIHPTAGAVAVGAREQIINFNVNLKTRDMAFAKELARSIRTSGGGLPALRAKEIDLASKGQAQISTVLTDYKTTSIKRVIDEIAKKTAERGIQIAGTEIVGLLPREALVDFSLDQLAVENFNPDVQILENRLAAVSVNSSPLSSDWLSAFKKLDEAFASTDAVPGGGAGAAVSAGLGASLGLMALGISLKSKKLDPANRPALEDAHKKLGSFQSAFERLAKEDADAFEHFMTQAAMPKDAPLRTQHMQEALFKAAQVPLETAQAAMAAHQLVSKVAPLCSSVVVSDAHCALHLLLAAVQCAIENVRINLNSLKDPIKKVAVAGPLEPCEEFVKTVSHGA